MVFAVYIIGGTFMDALAMLILTLPIFYPLVVDKLAMTLSGSVWLSRLLQRWALLRRRTVR